MTDRSDELSEFQLVGGSIKLNERPSTSSHSSLLKRYNLSRFTSRPSSAIPRLCSVDNMLENFTPTKNVQRPYSADFATPIFLSSKSKETLTDGSFESIYVPLDCRLPSSNLFKELLEEDVDQWRSSDTKSRNDMNSKREDNMTPNSIPILVVNELSDKKMSDENESNCIDEVPLRNSTESEREKMENKTEIIERELSSDTVCTNADQSYSPNGTLIRRKNEDKDSSIKDAPSVNDYNLTPGLTTKPPLPKKSINAHVVEPDMHNDAIYDFFAIKYNLEYGKSISLTGNAEKPMCEESPREEKNEKPEKRNVSNELVDNHEIKNNKDENTFQYIKTVRTFDLQKKDDYFNPELSLDTRLQRVSSDELHRRESKVDEPMSNNTKTEMENHSDFPPISEIDIDELFRLGNGDNSDGEVEISKKFQIVSGQSSPKSTSNHSGSVHNKDLDTMKTTKSKVTFVKKPRPAKISLDKSVVSNQNNNKKKTFNKPKFIALPINLGKIIDSPRHKENTIEDNIETWISTDVKKPRIQDFTDLINTLEDLKCTTDVNSGDVPIPCDTPVLDDEKQVEFDEIETIIEALEYQDQTSQNNIKSMKKIVTSELSNSMILNENKNNLNFVKKKKDSCEAIFRNTPDSSSSLNGNDSGLVSPTELYVDNVRTDTPEKSHSACEVVDNFSENQKIIPRATKNEHSHPYPARTPGCLHNYKELLSYLDEADKKCTKTLEVARERVQTSSQVLESTNLLDTMPKVEDLLTHTPEELASYVIDTSLRLKDKTSCISLLQNELSSLREKLLTQSKQAEINLRQKLKEQKEETERITKRHQKFIDQLMEEKKTFARRCEELVDEMTAMEEKYVSNMRAVEHKHQVEMQKMKDMHAASEKLRRERWIEGRTQKIKEMAVKSIEPEVERIEKRHQEELSNLRSVHKREIEELELRAARKLQEHSETLRGHLIQDREKALVHERDVMRLRYEKMVESEERNYQEQRRRLIADHANRVADCEERESQAVADKERAIKQAHEEFEEKCQAAARRHANEIKLVKESVVIELENWKNSFRKQQSTLLMEKETSIKKECRKERDREIEIVIERLEEEANIARTQLEQTTENRVKRLRDKYEAEIRDLEMLEKDSQNKYSESRSKLVDYEDVILTLRTTIKQLEKQLTEEKLKCSKLESEREEIRQAIRKEYEDKMLSLEREVEDLRTSADKQVEQLYSRVRVSLARKDDLLEELTNDHKALKEKCVYLENMIEQQRKEFMIHS